MSENTADSFWGKEHKTRDDVIEYHNTAQLMVPSLTVAEFDGIEKVMRAIGTPDALVVADSMAERLEWLCRQYEGYPGYKRPERLLEKLGKQWRGE